MEAGEERVPENTYYKTPMLQLSYSNRRLAYNNDLRVYQAWKASMRSRLYFQVFCFEGRLVFGPDCRSLFLTVSLIVTPVAVFCAFVAPKLVTEFPHPPGHLFTAICAVFMLAEFVAALDH